MKYGKPELTMLGPATAAIRHNGKGSPFVRDNASPNYDTATANAYEADE
jgi:hypothetical protein